MQVQDQQFKQVDKYIISNDVLGQGQFGTVKRGFFKDDLQRRVAVKIIPLKNAQKSPQFIKQLRTEIDILMKCGDGDLKGLLQKRQGKLTESEAIQYFRQISEGFKSLYSLKIIHRDIKPANILIREGRALISDFGFAKCLDSIIGMEEQIKMTLLGTPLYMAPQIIGEEHFSSKCDIWSLGMLFYEMLYGKTPWYGKNCKSLLENIHGQPLQFPSYPKTSDLVKDMLTKMLQIKEEDRIGWPELFEHPLIKLDIEDVKAKINEIQNQEGDQLLRSVEVNQYYCKNNKVIGIDKQQQAKAFNINGNQSVHNNSSYMKGDNQMNTAQSNVRENKEIDIGEFYQKQEQEQKLRKKDLEIDSYLVFERNIGIFINLTANYVFRLNQKQIIQVDHQLFYRVIFVLQKKQLVKFQFLLDVMEGKAFPSNQFYNLEDLKHYQSTKEYTQTKQVIQNDNSYIKPYFEGIYEKNKNFLQQFSGETDIKEFYKILNYDLSVENPDFDFIYTKTLNQFLIQLDQLIGQITSNKRELLQTILYLIICKNPYQRFKLNSEDNQAQFHQFYDRYDKDLTEDEIYKEIQDQIQQSN
ncbi:Protein kinase-like domain [Pseudocohnilembus persalinus]|uniref:Protein kinase-like domain n=1 Tax=Pseudocohnilembus persalinus TaxID=266149 RepID=A0A0V0QEV4_PSEPJ|nr:Protein kinase-like domain [Pseudocohnilembus persalinus]|eukprot:KRX00707.1 Protein kinase-like domain [Pseudocohnilembus persalinus]